MRSFYESVFLFTIQCSSPSEPFGSNALFLWEHSLCAPGGAERQWAARGENSRNGRTYTWRDPGTACRIQLRNRCQCKIIFLYFISFVLLVPCGVWVLGVLGHSLSLCMHNSPKCHFVSWCSTNSLYLSRPHADAHHDHWFLFVTTTTETACSLQC